MTFSSIEFLFFFLPVSLALYLAAPARLRNLVLLLTSLLFYTWGVGGFVLVLLASVAVNYAMGLLVARPERRWRRLGEAASVAVNLGVLAYYKYANFFVDQASDLLRLTGGAPIAWTAVALPIGISFFTFQSMSYVFDVARGRSAPLRNPLDFAMYVAMFPQLVAGPIVRFHEIADRIRARATRLPDVAEGACRFCFGLVKKVVIADPVGAVADAAFASPVSGLGAPAAWLGALAYTLQIYFDFSAYSDMAIGLGRILGFRLPENFNRPYSALSVTDFWRRWHITLSSWFRDYLYIPLGGSRVGPARTWANLVLVFLLVGLWHGAAWTFVAWGAYHGALLILERATGRRHVESAPFPALARATTLLLVLAGWVLFRADDLGHAAGYYAAMSGLGGSGVPVPLELALDHRALLTLCAASIVFLLPRDFETGVWVERGRGWRVELARAVLLAALLPYAGALVASGSFSPFLYFRF